MFVSGNNNQNNNTSVNNGADSQGNNQQQAVANAIPKAFLDQNPSDLAFLRDPNTDAFSVVPKEQVQEQRQEEKKEETKSDPYEQRFAILEQGLATIGAYLQGQQQNLNKSNSQQQSQPEEFDYTGTDVSDPNNIRDIIRNEFKSLLKTELQPLLSKHDELGVRTSFAEAHARFGDDFKNNLPLVDLLVKNGILKSDPNMNFVAIHQVLNEMKKLMGSSAKDSTIQPVNGTLHANGVPSKPQTADALVQRANALSTESQGAQRNMINNANPRKGTRAYTLDDAVDDAFNEIFGQR